LSKTNFYYGCIPPERSKTPAFEVIQAGNADEAIAILKARPDIHVVFTDIQMPGSMDGLKLARFVRDRWPPIKIVATSGHVPVEDDDLPADSIFLPKPYLSQEVVATLRELTGRGCYSGPGCRSIGIKNLCFSLTRCCIPGPSSIIRKKF
jgi:CheY-like chemotaxis protein